jgi:hypothetical protein
MGPLSGPEAFDFLRAEILIGVRVAASLEGAILGVGPSGPTLRGSSFSARPRCLCGKRFLFITIRVARECGSGSPERKRREEDLHRFEADLALLLGAGFADPYYTAAHRAQRVLVQDKFDYLSASQVEIPVEPESLFRGIDHQAGNPCLVSLEIDDQTGALLRDDPLRSAAFRDGRGGGHRAAPQGQRLKTMDTPIAMRRQVIFAVRNAAIRRSLGFRKGAKSRDAVVMRWKNTTGTGEDFLSCGK